MNKKGFTLIELLVVIAIIGILAAALLVSLGGARKAARDARRIGDLKNTQAALELYFNKCAKYPADKDCDETTNPGDWTALTNAVKDADIGVRDLPVDPDSAKSYGYGVDGTNQSYLLQAFLETDNAALKNDIDSSTGYSNALDCADVNFGYCVGL